MTKSTLTIAVLIIPPIQLLDLSPIDLFHMLGKQYLRECNLPQPFTALGLDEVRIFYVAEHGPNSSSSGVSSTTTTPVLAQTTASLSIVITHGLTAAEVQPGRIDVLLIPGPDPSLTIGEDVKGFLRGHAACPDTTVMSVCTGVIPLAQAGILDGRVCTGPRALLGMFLRRDFPRVKWGEKRWVVDGREGARTGELWTAGGITNGQDMVAAFIRTKFRAELGELVCKFADVGGRGQEYGNGSAVEGMSWGWLLLRSWVGGLFGRYQGVSGTGKSVEGKDL